MIIQEACYAFGGRDRDVTKRHTHAAVELIQVKQGTGSVLKSNRSYPLAPDRLYIIDARCPHIVYPEDCDQYVRNKIVIDFSSFHDFCTSVGLGASIDRFWDIPPIPTENEPQIDGLFLTVSRLFESGSEEDLAFAHGYILELLHFVLSRSESSEPAVQNVIVQKTLDLIRAAGGTTSLTEVSEHLHLNKYYLCHLFRDKTGITLTEYIAEKRYERSLHLLRTTDDSIERVSELCGFEYLSSFTRFFRKRCGMSPLEYRKSCKR